MGKYTEEFKMRLTPVEKERLLKLAKQQGISASAYIRWCISNQEIRVITKEEMSVRKELIREMSAIGNNINQIARNTNSGFYSESEKRKLFGMLQTITEKLNQIMEREN